jgi:YggT family protein
LLSEILILILNTVAGILAGVLLLRFWMQAIRVRPPSNIGQFIYTLSDWIVLPLRRMIPGTRGLDWATLIAAIIVTFASVSLELGILSAFSLPAALSLTLLHLITWACYGLIALLIIEAIFSWVNPHAPLAPFVGALNEPVLRPLRRVIPLVGGIDLSPLVALIIIQIILRLAQSLLGFR